MKPLLLALAGSLFLTLSAFAGDEADVAAATDAWRAAIDARDPQAVSSLYDPQALLYATFQTRLDSPKKILSYFKHLTEKPELKVKFHRQDIRVFDGDAAINSGLYVFSYSEDGRTVSVPARYTFVYVKDGGDWKIINHHSSVDPEN